MNKNNRLQNLNAKKLHFWMFKKNSKTWKIRKSINLQLLVVITSLLPFMKLMRRSLSIMLSLIVDSPTTAFSFSDDIPANSSINLRSNILTKTILSQDKGFSLFSEIFSLFAVHRLVVIPRDFDVVLPEDVQVVPRRLRRHFFDLTSTKMN